MTLIVIAIKEIPILINSRPSKQKI